MKQTSFEKALAVANLINSFGSANFGLSLDICRCFDYNDVNYNVTRSQKTESAIRFGGVNTKTALNIKKRYTMRNFGVGKDVVKVLFNRLNKQRIVEGKEPFKADECEAYNLAKPNGFTVVEGTNGVLLRSDKNPDKYAIRVYPNVNVEYATKGYYIGDKETEERVATEEEINILKKDLREPKSDYSKKQANFGITEEKFQLKFRTIYIDNLLSITDGKLKTQIRNCGVAE